MTKIIKLRKGLDIHLEGEAEKVVTNATHAQTYAIQPSDFVGLVAKPLIKEGEEVMIGTPIFFDKENPRILFTSPVSGTLKEIVRGDKRKILAFTITPNKLDESVALDVPLKPTAEQAKEYLLQAGLWPMLVQRPFGTIANPEVTPREIYVSSFDTSPLAPDMEFVLQDQKENIERAVALLGTIAPVNIGANSSTLAYKGAATTIFQGPHPAGNVGVQIANTRPISKGEIVWTIDIQHLAIIGRSINTGRLDFAKTIALTGSQASRPHYIKCVTGASLKSIIQDNIKGDNVRYLSGNPLTGTNAGAEGYLGFFHNQVTLLPEGNKYEFVGWAMPGLTKFSVSRTFFSWLTPTRKYNLDTNLHGGERAFVMNGIYEKVLPMDIYPVYLLKAIMAMDIDKMENLGIYEIIEEDVALCEFVCPSKIEWQVVLREGITKMIKEL